MTLVVTDSKGNTDEQDVTVKVTDIEEDGVVTLSTLQPRVGFPVTATLADPDNVDCGQRRLAVVSGYYTYQPPPVICTRDRVRRR